MKSRNSMSHCVLVTLAVLVAALCTSCTPCVVYTDLCDLIGGVPEAEVVSSNRMVVLEDPGTIAVWHGFSCSESDKRGIEDVLKVEESLELQRYARATVFLNGWRMTYLSSDHHVGGLGTMISNIRMEGSTLKWQAAGALSDKNFDDGYRWCYHYTVVAWNPANLNLVVDQRDGSCESRDPAETNFFITDNAGTTTALSAFSSFLFNPGFASGRTVAVLPRGFGFRWSSDCETDHHLLQLGFNLDHAEAFVENEKNYKKGFREEVTPIENPPLPPTVTHQVDSGFVSWETYAIFKDNAGRRGYGFGEMVSGLGGPDVGVIQPPFAILPIEDKGIIGACLGEGPGEKTEEVTVENVPFEYAIPMLVGWDLHYGCDDEQVTEIGTWLDEFQYEKAAGDPTGTLRYKVSSILKDKDGSPGHAFSHKVAILGIKPIASAVAPDLVPFSPLGTDPLAFCRLEDSGTLLRVTVRNQGNGDAAASRTTVLFRGGPVTLDTPPVPAGASVDLLFNVPSNCFSPDCSFTIRVDSDNQVDEFTNEGNNSANGGCLG
ncbi:MAG: CARDB domain-containing protein [Syntrophotaleaceae bacterium]